MKRPKLGDVYYVKVPNGYKLFQWAYSIPKKGDYIRVFDGLYESVPEKIEQIVAGPHSYIIPFYSSKAYRIGLACLIGNYPIPENYPFPDYMVHFYIHPKTNRVYEIEVMSTIPGRREWRHFAVSSMEELPLEYRNLKLLNSCVPPAWLLYLFDMNFSMERPELFSPGENHEEALSQYIEIVNEALEKDKEMKKKK